jgi:hypothetical protein
MVFLVVRAGLGGDEGESMDIKNYLLPFTAAFVVCAAAFLLLDMAAMNLQGLSLIFSQ